MSAGDIASIVTAAVAVLAAGGAYVQFVLRRSLLPSVQFDVELATVALVGADAVGDVALVITNTGSSMLVVTNVRFKARYHVVGDHAGFFPRNPTEPLLARRIPAAAHAWVEIAAARTFVQPGVTQKYRKPVLLPAETAVVNILGSFDYRVEIGPVTRLLVGVFARPPRDMDWRSGISNHTVRRTVGLTGLSGG